MEWLYAQDLSDLQALPDTVVLEGIIERADRLREAGKQAAAAGDLFL